TRLNEGSFDLQYSNFQKDDKKRIYLKKIDFSGNFRGNVIEDSSRYLIEKTLINLGFKTVQNVNEIRQETAERKEMRNNIEVNQSTLPASKTIEREDYELFCTIYSLKTRKDFELFALIKFSLWGIYGLDIEKSRSTIGIVFKFVDNTTQTSEYIVRSVGQTESIDELEVGGLGIYYQKNENKDEAIEFSSFVKALNKAGVFFYLFLNHFSATPEVAEKANLFKFVSELF
ncbi:MAG: hypothetical protein UR93_C0006G0041, partial [Berkelbacteria bacterium GW2011_GWA2_35_9]